MSHQSRMYDQAKTWNPFKGCEFACTYCVPSFQRQAKRQKNLCSQCYAYEPHCHPERLEKIPSAQIVFVCGNGDISFCDPEFTKRIIAAIRKHNEPCRDKTYYLQSKQPEYFDQFLADLPSNVVLVTTLETNRDEGYGKVSKAPPPSERYRQFRRLRYPRKAVTIEPVMAFDLDIFTRRIRALNPEYIYLGFNSRPNQVELPEPTPEELQAFIRELTKARIEIRGKDLRGIWI